MTKPNILIGTPMYGGQCSGHYTLGVMNLRLKLHELGWDYNFRFIFNESLITRARNAIAAEMFREPYTHLVFIDADMQFEANDIIKMIEADKDIICGICPKKEINWSAILEAARTGVPVEKWKEYSGSYNVNILNNNQKLFNVNEPLEVRDAGTGLMIIKRQVFDNLKSRVPCYINNTNDTSGLMKIGEKIFEFFTTSIDDQTKVLLSEDFHFCHLWRKQGGSIHVAPWVKLAHYGAYLFEGSPVRRSEEPR